MKKTVTVLAVAFCVTAVSSALASPMKFIAMKHVDQDQLFLYRCNHSGNLVEVYRHYDSSSGMNQVRFIVDGKDSEWFVINNNPEIFNELATDACGKSTTRNIAVVH